MVASCHTTGGPVAWVLTAILILAFSGVPGLVIAKPGPGQKIAALLAVLASLLGIGAAGWMMAGAVAETYLIDWPLPFGSCELSADPLSTLFLLPLFLATGCCAVYATAYWPARENRSSEKKLTFFFGLLPAAMALVLLARNGVLLLMAWEVMALAAYFLLTTDQRDPGVQRAGTVYLFATHTGTMALFVLFSLLRTTTGSFLFPALHLLSPDAAPAIAILVAALIGFGAKAGIMPLHIWLPGAHANAPSHISAMMSGVMLKMGVYGILRTVSFFSGTPDWFGWLILLLGAISAVTGISLASVQKDLKRLLACSSIENIGIVFIGMGMALVGLQSNNTGLIVFGLFGCFLHVINHGLFKPLLFLGSGIVIHATGTREIDRMGGLSRRLPRSAPLFLIGSLAICGLPPLNGFVGELFLYFGAFNNAVDTPTPTLALIAPLLAIVGGLAVITFVKLFGMIFLGSPRSAGDGHFHETADAMVAPMALLALLCFVAGIFAPLMMQLVEPVVAFFGGVQPHRIAHFTGMVPLVTISVVNGVLLVLVLAAGLVYRRMRIRMPQTSTGTWGCGYLAPTSRMQYTGTSFSETAANFLGGIAGTRRQYPVSETVMPGPALFRYAITETILDRLLTPMFVQLGYVFSLVRRMQHGQLHIYMLYIFATLFVLMLLPH
ncbi:hydrogenase-4 component B [Geobacter sp. OR-1]|uniref:proton-conducting transporter transmembrane domain-containing protein n=1 Tax=Geobacter sp. OR-1 TaxID=1266765 RepID=UPI0005428086|nr:proton-conducting transporter membrane subunit [Geobacter sp. OR-1]GAM08468.1 hydrogenase-4 component B [Geobacter sp. OR-1]